MERDERELAAGAAACHSNGMTARSRLLRRTLPLAAFLAALAGAAAAAPPSGGKDAFGIPMGAPVRKVEGAKPFKPGWYHVAAPPRPDPRFVRFAVEAFADTGVCVVQGVSAEIAGDPDGAKIRSAIDRLADDFSAVYGQPQRLDVCEGSICRPEVWGEDLQLGARRYGYRWALHGSPADAVREVSVVAVPHSVSSSVYLVQFDSGRLSECRGNELRSGAAAP